MTNILEESRVEEGRGEASLVLEEEEVRDFLCLLLLLHFLVLTPSSQEEEVATPLQTLQTLAEEMASPLLNRSLQPTVSGRPLLLLGGS